jgi:DNA-binding transcriptional ArsR family regulator
MTDAAAQLPEIDRLIHEPARLAILTVLSSCSSADFVALQRITNLSKGNLSVQLTKLEEAGLIGSQKEIVHRKMRTTLWLTARGKHEMKRYWETLDHLRSARFGPA